MIGHFGAILRSPRFMVWSCVFEHFGGSIQPRCFGISRDASGAGDNHPRERVFPTTTVAEWAVV